MSAPTSSWRKSTHCGPDRACVEAARFTTHVAVRDGKQTGTEPVLRISLAAWRALLSHVKTGDPIIGRFSPRDPAGLPLTGKGSPALGRSHRHGPR